MAQSNIPNKLEVQSDSGNEAELESLESRNRGGTEPNKRLNKLRSIKLPKVRSFKQSKRWVNSRSDRVSSILSGNQATPQKLSPIPMSDASPNYMKATSCSSARKENFQASPRNSESSFGSVDSNWGNSNHLKPNVALLGQKSVRALTRRSSFKPMKGLTRMSSLRSKRSLMKKNSGATCSSTLKNSNFPHHVELHSGGSESERISVMKVCPYKYCSLNGHCHAPLPPLKPFLLRRRRMLKTQKTMKRHFSGLEKEIQAYKMAFNIDTSRAGSPTAEKAGEDFFVEIYAKPSGKSKGEGAHGGDGEAKSDSGSLDEVLLGETSYPQIGMEESPSQLSHFQAANCSNKKGSDESVSEATDRDWKEEEIVASNLDNESHNSNVIDDQPDSVVFCSLEGEGPGLCNKPSSTLDDTESTSHEEVAVGGNVFQEVHEEFVSVLNSESNEGGSESNGEKADDLTIATGEPSSPSKSTQPYDHLESITINGVVHSASTCGPLDKLTEGGEEKHGVSKLDYGSLRGCSPAGDSELPCNSDEAIESQLEKQKFIRMWRLIYQHVVSGTAAKVRTQLSLDGAEGEKQQDEADSVVNGDACQDFSETNPDMEDNGADCQKIELCQIDAIRLVEEAIDGILLPETQDNLSDDHSVTSDTNSDQEISETNHGKDKERNIPASPSPAKDGFRELNEIHGRVADPEQTLLKHDNTTVQVREKTIFKVEDKPSQKMRKSWSNLKKVILLKKFIKAVEKVSKFNPQEPRYLPLQPKSEAEKIYLRHQEMEGRKSAEEWMLDYALQQVVSKLTPARRRKVALLVEAFEAISPLQDIESPLKPTAAVPFHGKPVQASISSSGQGGEETGKENDGGNYGYLRGNPSPGDSEPESNTDVTYRNQMDKQTRNRMWYLIYQHVVSGIGANVESHGLLDDVNKTLPQGASETDQNKDHPLDNPSSTVSKVGSKSNQPVSKNWSNLKKLILLKRFVKSLEKVKKFNPRGPRFLPLKPDPEAEKICLRHQTTEDRKNSEEWMLDYALQQVVTKLSPARRRRVELLVEAFETVTPPSQIEAQKRHNAASRATSWPLRKV
uniref:Calmodulin-binding domain-containing protein n=1 Tax=Vitis vinifera TaxID=29760 RepID=F6HLN8_VITVI